MKRILLLGIALIVFTELKAQLFSQDFSSSTTVSSYVSATPSIGQFTSINNATNNPTSIISGALRYTKTGGSTGYFARTANFASTPTLIQIKFDFQVSAQASGEDNVATFYVGDNLTDNTSISNSQFHSRISFNFSATAGSFGLRDVGAGTNGANTFAGKQTITFVVNNSGSTQTYTPPGGGTESVANDSYDIWVGTTKEINDGAATTASAELKQFKFLYPSSSANATLEFDNFIITELTTLPISLTSFTGKPVDQAVLLNWVTASEKDNQSFEILKSYDGKNFSTLTTVTGAGNSDSEKAYSFTDENPYPGTNYYQLTQTDVNGAVSVAKTISVNSNVKGVKLSAYAAASSVSINISSPNQSNGTLTLYDIAGRKIESKQVALIKGFNEVSFAQSLNKGIYFVNLITDGTTTSLKFVK